MLIGSVFDGLSNAPICVEMSPLEVGKPGDSARNGARKKGIAGEIAVYANMVGESKVAITTCPYCILVSTDKIYIR